MKYILTTIFFIWNILNALGQLPHWVIPPTNDTLYVVEGKLIKGEQKGKTSFWALDGKLLYSTELKTNEFRSRIATIQKSENGEIVGFINNAGRFTKLPDVLPVYDHPYFENGILITKNNDKFVLYNKDGHELQIPQLHSIYPFSHGYAPFVSFRQPEKQKNPYYNYLKPDGSSLQSFIIQEQEKEKVIEPKDVQFLSALDNTEKGLAIVKNKLYWFLESNYSLIPILMGEETEKKRHLTLDNKQEQNFTNLDGQGLKIYAKYGKDKQHIFEFDNKLRLINQTSTQDEKKTKTNEPSLGKKNQISEYKRNNLFGLILNNKDSLPCQFEQVGLKYGNNAFVKSNGKWGILELKPDLKYNVRLNNGEEMLFRHQKFLTQLHIDLPSGFSVSGIGIDVPDLNGCSIDVDSREDKNSGNDNYTVYNCTLTAPDNLTDSLTNISYGPLMISLENVKLKPIMIDANVKYDSPYSIEIPNGNVLAQKNKTEFDIIVNVDKEHSDETYPYEVSIESESLQTRCEKSADDTYKCFVEHIEEGSYGLDFILKETGCPPCVFPLEISYTGKGKVKVGLKTNGQIAESDSVTTVESQSKSTSKHAVVNKKKATTTASSPLMLIEFEDGYMAGEVTESEATFRSGPGTKYPVATYTIDGLGTQEIPAPYKGQIIKVKEEGEWYLRYPSLPVTQTPTPEYISKKQVVPLKSNRFIINDLTKPCIYVSTQDIFDEALNKEQYIDEIVAYPGGVCVEYCEGKLGAMVKFGRIVDGNPAIEWKYRIQTRDGGELTLGSKSSVSVDNNKSMHRLRLNVAPQDKKNIKEKNRSLKYIDFSTINYEEWENVLKDYLLTADPIYDNHLVSVHECDILTKDMLEKKYTKVK